MTSISSQLSSLFSGSSGTGLASGSASLTQSLAAALQSASGSSVNSGNNDNAYLLNLSPAARNLLSAHSAASSANTGKNTEFTLSKSEQQTIESILEKYKNAPYDQATFDSIKSELAAAGLGTNTLALKDQVSSFNATSEFLSALNGNTPDLTAASSSGINGTTEQTKATNYLQAILTAFQSISTDYAAQKAGSASPSTSLTA